MGFLTTFTVYNDGVDLIDPSRPENEENIKDLASAVHKAARGMPERTGQYSFPVGGFSNLINVQTARHADDVSVYVHRSNTLTEMNAKSALTRQLMESQPQFAKTLIKTMEEELMALKALMKDIEKAS